MTGRPRPGGPDDPRAAANDADDSAPADAALTAVLVHGLTPVRVVLAGHDPGWARRFAARAAELRRVLGERASLIGHVGSTAVPGLAAKPVVDILVGIDDPNDEAAYLPGLEAAGYDLTVREPQHRWLRAGDPSEPVNLHCYPPGPSRDPQAPAVSRSPAPQRPRPAALRGGQTGTGHPVVAGRELLRRRKGPVITEILRTAGWTAPPND